MLMEQYGYKVVKEEVEVAPDVSVKIKKDSISAVTEKIVN